MLIFLHHKYVLNYMQTMVIPLWNHTFSSSRELIILWESSILSIYFLLTVLLFSLLYVYFSMAELWVLFFKKTKDVKYYVPQTLLILQMGCNNS